MAIAFRGLWGPSGVCGWLSLKGRNGTLAEQLGLRLEIGGGPVDVVVVEDVARIPTANRSRYCARDAGRKPGGGPEGPPHLG